MATTSQIPFDDVAVRAQFPALQGKQVYMDNAGGSQVLSTVIESISAYLTTNNVQLGASYPIAKASTAAFTEGHAAGARYINASPNEVVYGPSTTQLFRNLSMALKVEKGDEFILSNLDHEANLAAWVQLAEWKGLTVKWWIPSEAKDSNPKLEPEDLKKLMTDKTRVVCCTHTSNILGSITDVAAISKCVHENSPNALLVVDAVAYAPHGPVDVKALGVDFYAFSWYKVYGPHIAMLYGSERAQQQMQSLGHYFKSGATMEDKLGLAGASYELIQAIPQVVSYVESIGWDAIAKQEETIQETLLAYLRSKPDTIKIYGDPSSSRIRRVPVISFRVKGQSSLSIIDGIESHSDYACRNGHFYSKRLCDNVLELPNSDDGVVRCSLLHYNTNEEVEGLVRVLDHVIAEGVKNVKDEDSRRDVANW